MNPLEQLRDIHLPPEPGIWPLTYGWWILAFLFTVLIGLSIWWWRRRRLAYLAKRQALQELRTFCEQDNWPQLLNQLVKRVVLQYSDPSDVASLHGQKWLDYLAAQLPEGKREGFIKDYQALMTRLYQTGGDNPRLFRSSVHCVENWIRAALPLKSLTHSGKSDV